MFLAAREAAHQRLYSHVPWLRQRVLATVEEYARGITMDFSAMEEFAKDLDPSALTDPSKLEALMQQGTFEPQNTPEQKAALERLRRCLHWSRVGSRRWSPPHSASDCPVLPR